MIKESSMFRLLLGFMLLASGSGAYGKPHKPLPLFLPPDLPSCTTLTSDGTFTDFTFTALDPGRAYKLIVNIYSVTVPGTYDPVLQLGSGQGPTWHTAAADYVAAHSYGDGGLSGDWYVDDGEGLSISDGFTTTSGSDWQVQVDMRAGAFSAEIVGWIVYNGNYFYGIGAPAYGQQEYPIVVNLISAAYFGNTTAERITGFRVQPMTGGAQTGTIAPGSTATLCSIP
jgi:hypothetical protein